MITLVLEAVVSGKGRLLAGDTDGTEAFHYMFSKAYSDMVGPGQHVACPPCPSTSTLSPILEGWTSCSHLMTQCTPHIQLPLAHFLGLEVCQWALYSANGKTTQAQVLGVSLAHLGRDSQGSSTSTWSEWVYTLGSVDSSPVEEMQLEEAQSGSSKVQVPHCQGLRDVMPFSPST